MKVDSIQVQNFRNIVSAQLFADPELTVITGQNGQGKTNLLESIWLLTGSKSFRGAKDLELVKQGEDFARIIGETNNSVKTNKIEVLIAGAESGKRGRSAKVNGVPYGRAASIAGVFTAVVFDPGHLSLVKGGPEGRRRFLDAALCQLYPGYINTLRRFTRAISQKNALLKKYYETSDAAAMLDAFDVEIVQTGTEISARRAAYLTLAGPLAQQLYAELSSGAEQMEVTFLPCAPQGQLAGLLKNSRPTDIRAGFCTAGPHREDFETTINGKSARVYGSQGQQRSAVLGFKLAEAACAKEITGEHPVMLLDDVLSELDETRQAYLLSRMSGKQSFVTTCDASAFGRTAGKIVEVKGGQLI
ncbi:DNA replication/repair protein RecF [Ruminococcaceae bacterium OttesenSCG-928-A16]|nr:DNA replication/repair protein RecF [Ruminococcaceae bacterium OttesenSCG-928-A16]